MQGDHEQAADAAEAQAEELKRHGDQLDERIESARDDWETKKSDGSVPGAQPDQHGSAGEGGERGAEDE